MMGKRAKTGPFDFPAKDHVALAEGLDLVDFEAGSSVAGQKFYFLKNEAVLLELALQQYVVSFLIGRSYTPMITPVVSVATFVPTTFCAKISRPRRRSSGASTEVN